MSDVFFGVTVASFAISFLQSFFQHSRASQRRIFFICACVGALSGFLSFYPEWTNGLGAAAFVIGAMAVIAYAYTPYIKIRGKIYSLATQTPDPEDDPAESSTGQHDPEPDAYSGLLTAPKMWWILIPLMLISVINTYAWASGEGEGWVAAIGIAFLVFLSIVTGYGDASWGYPIAREQRLQFIILAVVSLATFTVLYLAAYAVAQRHPVRSKHSMEYRAHRRFREDRSE